MTQLKTSKVIVGISGKRELLASTTKMSESGYSSVRIRNLRSHACLEGIKVVEEIGRMD